MGNSNVRSSGVEIDSWWYSVAQILPPEMVTHFKEQNQKIKELHCSYKQLSDTEIANFEAIISYKAGHTGVQPLYKIIEGGYKIDAGVDKTLSCYKKIFRDMKDKKLSLITEKLEKEENLSKQDITEYIQRLELTEEGNLSTKEKVKYKEYLLVKGMVSVIERLTNREKLAEAEISTYQEYLLKLSKNGFYFSYIDEEELIALLIKNPYEDQIVRDLRGNLSPEGAEILQPVWQACNKFKGSIEKIPFAATVLDSLVAERDCYQSTMNHYKAILEANNLLPETIDDIPLAGAGMDMQMYH